MDSLFTGAHTRRPTVNLGGARLASTPASHQDLLLQARQQRLHREDTRRRDTAARAVQAFYRGRREAAAARATFRARFDTLLPSLPAAPPPSPADTLAASRLLAVAFVAGNKGDIRRLAAWCRVVLRPPHGATDKTPLLFALFRREHDPEASWPTLVRMIGTLLFIQATSSPSLPQSPLFLELTKILCDPASYTKYSMPPALAPPDTLLRFLLEQRDLYPRIAQLVQSIDQPTHPTLAPSIALALLPFRAFPPSTPQRALALSSLAHSLLALPDLLSRLAPAQVSQLTAPTSALPFWELLAALSTTSSPISPTLLATLAELALRPHGGRVSAEKGAVPGAKEVSAWMEVVRRGLEGLPRGALDGELEGKGKGVAPTPVGAEDAEDEESEMSDDDDAAVERARAAVGAAPAAAVGADDARMAAAPAPLSPATRRSLALLASPSHLLTLLTLSTRHAASTRPALASLLTTLLALLPAGTPRDSALHTLLYAPSAAGLLRELYRGYLRSGALARALANARERTQGVLAALDGGEEHARSGEWAVLILVVEMYSRALVTLGDDEFYASSSGANAGGRNPLTLDEVVGLSALARNVAFALYWSEDGSAGAAPLAVRRVVGTGCTWEDVRGVMTRFLQQVHARDSRRQFTPEGHWLMTSAMDIKHFVETAVYEDERLEAEGAQDAPAPAQPAPQRETPLSDSDEDDEFAPTALQPRRYGPARPARRQRTTPQQLSKRRLALVSPRLGVLQNVPFVIPFETRVAIFRQFVASDFARLGLGDAGSFGARSRHRAVVRRTHLAEDAFKQLNGLGAELKKRVEIAFVDEHGIEESGIDGGGLFKELLTSCVAPPPPPSPSALR
ncbi:ubiquitin-protein ligase (E3) [Rhodotorula kratochvilovae]